MPNFRDSNASTMALGFQLHFTDIYLEELAKASAMSECNANQRYSIYIVILGRTAFFDFFMIPKTHFT